MNNNAREVRLTLQMLNCMDANRRYFPANAIQPPIAEFLQIWDKVCNTRRIFSPVINERIYTLNNKIR
jgi:hypothetical protein